MRANEWQPMNKDKGNLNWEECKTNSNQTQTPRLSPQRMQDIEEDVELAEWTTQDEEEAREEIMAGGARECTPKQCQAHGGAEGWITHGGALVDRPGGTKGTTEAEQVEVEIQAELKRPGDTKGP